MGLLVDALLCCIFGDLLDHSSNVSTLMLLECSDLIKMIRITKIEYRLETMSSLWIVIISKHELSPQVRIFGVYEVAKEGAGPGETGYISRVAVDKDMLNQFCWKEKPEILSGHEEVEGNNIPTSITTPGNKVSRKIGAQPLLRLIL